jgi:hypothetical protein
MYLILTSIQCGKNIEDHPEIVSKLSNTALREANLILDLDNKDVIKCRGYLIDGNPVERDFDLLLKSVQDKYV